MDDAASIADGIRKVSSRGGACMNLDCPDWIKITRLGQAVVIEALGANGSILRKVITRGVAKSVANRLEVATIDALCAAQDAEKLLGDIDLGPDVDA